jgi:hypothetical protein
MIDLSELNYKQLIDLEKQIQKEKVKKLPDHLTKTDLTNSSKMNEIGFLIDNRFREEKYGWPQKVDVDKFDWHCERDKEEAREQNHPAPVALNMTGRIDSSIMYLCDTAFENYRDYISKSEKPKRSIIYYGMTGPREDQNYYSVAVNKEIPWQIADQYKNMYYELCDIFLKHAKGEINEH